MTPAERIALLEKSIDGGLTITNAKWLLGVARAAVAWREKHPADMLTKYGAAKWAGTTAALIAAIDDAPGHKEEA